MRALKALIVVVVMVGAAGVASPQTAAPPFRMIVHGAAPVASVDRAFIKDAFLKKTARWPNGEAIKPVDLGVGSPVRARFSEDVLRRSVAAVRAYWQQLIFSGREVPPVELPDSDSVVQYVAKHRGAVGYVAPGTKLDGVKEVSLK